MDPRENKAARMSVPQFGAWENSTPGANNYSVVFTQARENKKHQKTDLSEVKRKSTDQEHMNATYQNQNKRHQQHHAQAQAQAQANEDPASMQGKRRMLTYINCCIRP